MREMMIIAPWLMWIGPLGAMAMPPAAPPANPADPPADPMVSPPATTGPASTAAPSPAVGSAQPLLGGPEVSDHAARTLVQFDMNGRFVRVEGRPELAAVALLDLPPERREEARAVQAAHVQRIAGLLIDHIDLLRDSADAMEANDQERLQQIQRELYQRIDPEAQRDPLMPALAERLEADEQAEVARLVEEYWSAWSGWELRNARDKSEEAHRRTQQRGAFNMFQQELRQAYQRTMQPYRQKIEALDQIAQPTPEQRQAIRAILLEYIRETRLQPTQQQQEEVGRKIYEALDEERRMKVFQAILTRL